MLEIEFFPFRFPKFARTYKDQWGQLQGAPGDELPALRRGDVHVSHFAGTRSVEVHMAEAGRFGWFELSTSDPEAAKAFYAAVFAWTTEPFPGGGDYTMWVAPSGSIGGLTDLSKAAPGTSPGSNSTSFSDPKPTRIRFTGGSS